MKKFSAEGFFGLVSKIVYIVASIALMVVALVMIADGVKDIFLAITHFTSEFTYVLDGVGLIVIAVAIFEVGEYLLEEEVLRPRELRSAAEARKSLTKFLSILIIVTGTEAMMLIFKSIGHQEKGSLVYPALLIIAAAIALVALGVYQHFSGQAIREGADREVPGKQPQ